MQESKLHIVQSWKAQFVENNHQDCITKLREYETWKQINLYSAPHSHHYSEGQLIRIQGMIQDMHNPEYYVSKYTVHNKVTGTREVRSGKYKDIMRVDDEEVIEYGDGCEDAKERQSLFCIPIPGLNKWVLDLHKKNFVLPEVQHDNKTGRGIKRKVDDVDDDELMEEESPKVGPEEKKVADKTGNGSKPEDSLSLEDIEKFSYPIKDVEGQSFFLKIYEYDQESVVMNSMVEVVGFLSVDPAISYINVDEEMDGEEGQCAEKKRQVPASLIPRLHVVSIKSLEHCNPLLPSFNFSSEAELAFKNAEAAVCDLKILFTPLLFGDKLAVDFLICNMLSKVFLRKDVTQLGHLSLNFHELPNYPGYVEKFYNILSQLVTKSHYFPLTIEGLNSTPFVPKKDYTCDKLRSGLLQLSQGTFLVLDETKMSTGQLLDLGTRNVIALKGLLERQEVNYDFQFYTTPFQADLPVIIFSEKKSLFNCDAQIPLECDPESLKVLEASFEAAELFLRNEEVLARIRSFITAAQLANYEIPEDVQTRIQSDFVEMRQANKNFTVDDLHTLLNLARLLTLSRGCQSLTADIWKQACDMEGARQARL